MLSSAFSKPGVACLLSGFAYLSAASPIADPSFNSHLWQPPSFCPVITKVVSALGAGPEATSFCSSYLSIQTSTTTVTTTSTSSVTATATTTDKTSIVTASTSSVTTVTASTTSTVSVTSTVTGSPTTTATVTQCVDTPFSKRDLSYWNPSWNNPWTDQWGHWHPPMSHTSTSTPCSTSKPTTTSTSTPCPTSSTSTGKTSTPTSTSTSTSTSTPASTPTSTSTSSSTSSSTISSTTSSMTPYSSPSRPTTTSISTSKTSSSTRTPLSSFLPGEISSACSCLSIPTPTSTVTATASTTATITSTTSVAATSTTTPVTTTTDFPVTTTTTTTTTAPAATTTEAGNQGMQWALYTNPFTYDGDSTYSNFDPTNIKDRDPDYYGVTRVFGSSSSCSNPQTDLYGYEYQCNDFILNWRGYIQTSEEGTYTFTVNGIDDIILIWTGELAYSGWTRENALGEVSMASNTYTISRTLPADAYVPLRFIFGQAQGGYLTHISITAPDGTAVASDTAPSENLVTMSCDGLAPPYPPFGQET